MNKILCTVCYKNKATRIDNLYCEDCLEELIIELNKINPRQDREEKQKTEIKYRTIEEEYFDKKPKRK